MWNYLFGPKIEPKPSSHGAPQLGVSPTGQPVAVHKCDSTSSQSRKAAKKEKQHKRLASDKHVESTSKTTRDKTKRSGKRHGGPPCDSCGCSNWKRYALAAVVLSAIAAGVMAYKRQM